jgi:Ser/Thr protein kinase RdoA (MazF antagonist)
MLRDYTEEYISQLVLAHYGLAGQVTEMGGYTDKNFKIKVAN